MKLMINEEYANVNVWSFLKCSLFANILLWLIIYGAMALIGMLFLIV